MKRFTHRHVRPARPGSTAAAALVRALRPLALAGVCGALLVLPTSATAHGLAVPSIANFTPSSGAVGTTVTINGSGLTGATAVKLNGTDAASFTVESDSQITATVAAGTTSGTIAVTNPSGTGTSASPFTVLPKIASFSPTSGPIGQSVTITGSTFTGATAVAFNGTAAASFSVDSDTQITATVASGTSSGKVAVTTPEGSTLSSGDFTVTDECGSPAAPPCWTTFEVDGGAPPSGLQLQVSNVGGNLQVQLQYNGGTELSSVLGPSSVVHAVIDVGSYDPVFFGTTGLVQSYSASGSTVDFQVQPRSSSWLFAGCTISGCGDSTTTADVDYTSLVLAFVSDASGVPAAVKDSPRGTYVSTNAQALSLPPTFDPVSGAFSFTLAAPHLKHGGGANTGFFKTFLPDNLVVAMGISDPASVGTGSFTVSSSSGETITFSVSHVASPSGVLIQAGTDPANGLPEFHYSSPEFTIEKASSSGGGSSGGGSSGSSSSSSSSGVSNQQSSAGTASSFTASGGIAGRLTILGGRDSISWPVGAFSGSATVGLSTASAPSLPSGFAAGGTILLLTVTGSDGRPLTSFSQPLKIHIASPGEGTVPAYFDGTSWHLIPPLASPELPLEQRDGYVVGAAGSIDIYTRHATYFGTLRRTAPAGPASLSATYARGELRFSWATSGGAARYELRPLTALVPARTGSFTLVATDASGREIATATLTVAHKLRPGKLPKLVPAWAFRVLAWQTSGKRAARPPAPRRLPGWYWRWAAWRLNPLQIG